jgi:predicted ATP-dependent serine protease
MKRGRPQGTTKQAKTKQVKSNFKVNMKLVKMQDVKFNDDLFIPMKTKTIVDSVLSTEGGIFPGTNTIVIGDPGVGKSTVLLDWVCDLQAQGKKVLFISGEMNDIDMYGYVKRFPKFGKIDIMFMGEYSDCPKQAVEQVLNEGYDVVLMDSWAEVTSMVKDQMGWARNKVESWLLDLLEKQNKANNKANKNTAFICIQQMTKAGEFAGSNRIKHMTTAMAALRFDGRGVSSERYIEFIKNRRGSVGDKIYFSLHRGGRVDYSFELID